MKSRVPINNSIRLEIVSADSVRVLSKISSCNIQIFDVRYIDELTFQIRIHQNDYAYVSRIFKSLGVSVNVISQQGIFWHIRHVLKRPLTFYLLLLFSITLFLPTRVLFINVEGASVTPVKLIIECAEACGLSFGVPRRHVRSEQIKNQLLECIPQLQWVGVNTMGCVATVSVREKSPTELKVESKADVSSIVASRDGIVRDFTVLQGTPLCRIGDAVKKGQTLVSGYTDCGLVIKATRAEGEVYAQTLHVLEAVSPNYSTVRCDSDDVRRRYGLIIGKKRINFDKDSGISDGTCVKMYKEVFITLPGGFQLPVGYYTEYIYVYETEIVEQAETFVISALESFTQDYLESTMVAGTILQSNIQTHVDTNTVCLLGRYSCLEMIGQTKPEENMHTYGKSD